MSEALLSLIKTIFQKNPGLITEELNAEITAAEDRVKSATAELEAANQAQADAYAKRNQVQSEIGLQESSPENV